MEKVVKIMARNKARLLASYPALSGYEEAECRALEAEKK
jgi:hypothetical protein